MNQVCGCAVSGLRYAPGHGDFPGALMATLLQPYKTGTGHSLFTLEILLALIKVAAIPNVFP